MADAHADADGEQGADLGLGQFGFLHDGLGEAEILEEGGEADDRAGHGDEAEFGREEKGATG